MITANLWRLGTVPEAIPLEEAATSADAVMVLTVEAAPDDAERVHRELQRICGDQLTLEMVADLLSPDELPEVKQFGEGGHIRKVSSFGVRPLATEPKGDSGLVFEPIEFLAGDRWLIYHWQPCRAYLLGYAEPGDAEAQSRDDIENEVAKRWVDQGGQTPGDLGVLFLYELALGYTKARKTLWACLNDWEQEFYSHPTERDPIEFVKPLTELHRLHGQLYRRLAGLNVPRERADSGWFTNVHLGATALRVDEIIDRSLRNLSGFSDSLRQSVSLTQSYATVRHFALAEEQKKATEEQKKATEKLQHRFEVGAAVLLVPTLIAGIYGANTSLPGGGHWSGFVAMVILMVVGSGTAYTLLERGRGPDQVVTQAARTAPVNEPLS
ncbi:MAG: CorA family divalent cation transporter [Actinomycetes bacterium]